MSKVDYKLVPRELPLRKIVGGMRVKYLCSYRRLSHDDVKGNVYFTINEENGPCLIANATQLGVYGMYSLPEQLRMFSFDFSAEDQATLQRLIDEDLFKLQHKARLEQGKRLAGMLT